MIKRKAHKWDEFRIKNGKNMTLPPIVISTDRSDEQMYKNILNHEFPQWIFMSVLL